MSLSPSGLRGVDHIGFTVPDIDQAATFWCDILGAIELFRHGPHPQSESAERQFGRPADSHVIKIAMLRLGPTNIELLEISSPSARRTPLRPDDVGAHHVALYVDDLDIAVTAALALDVDVLGEPMPLPGPESGPDARFVFLRSPWGQVFELVSYPGGKKWQRGGGAELHDPRNLPRLEPRTRAAESR
ncbi:VOC family protein [Georgenia sp. Z1491]|uniref:VOC family protein n=1 Tax=Georgenia sp. Z1491 TaxID=3416707 RepID=UPI003CE68AC0